GQRVGDNDAVCRRGAIVGGRDRVGDQLADVSRRRTRLGDREVRSRWRSDTSSSDAVTVPALLEFSVQSVLLIGTRIRQGFFGGKLTDESVNAASRRRVPADAVDQQLEKPVGQLVGVATRPQPRIGPVRGREYEQGGRRLVEVGAKLAEVASFAKVAADPLFVTAAPLPDHRRA